MNSTRLLLIISSLTVLAIGMIVGPGCANMVPPEGGPRDSTPPRLQKANPGDSTLNFTGNRISFTFDDFVEIQNVQQELLVSPSPRIIPNVDWKLNTVSVRIRDTLEPNTTYTFNFGNSIKDINEGNILRNFTYTFSTGPYLDSLQFSGKVILAETGGVDSTLIVMLHSNLEDSAVVHERPRYVTKLDKQGNFVFRNLPPRTYQVYALKDESTIRRYFDDKQLFAFADQPVTISDSVSPVTLYAYASQPAKPAATPTYGITPGERGRKGINPATDRRLKFTTNLISEQQDLLGNFIMAFEQPIKSYDSSKVVLATDSSFNPVDSFLFEKDSTNRRLVLSHKWKENTLYHLMMDKDFLEDSTGKKLLKSDTISFRTRKLSDYGELRIRFRNLDMNRNPVLLFLLNDNITRSFPLSSPDFSQNLFLPGEYTLRILYDENKNGIWDPGSFFGLRKQPELVQPIGRTVVIKPHWENEFEIAL